jgi:hypothetical protein
LGDNLSQKLRLIRRFTGDRFSAGRGYDGRKKLSRKRQKTIDRYFDAITELTARPHEIYKPRRGEKKEVFEYTGQKGYAYFDRGIVHKPDEEAEYSFDFDRERPKGSRFQVINKNTGERSWHVPAEPFWEIDEDVLDTPDDLTGYYQDILDEYAEDAEVFLINAGEHHMWGSAGGAPQVADKLADLMNQYGSRYFDPFNKNSNHINNWFRGITAFSSDRDVAPYIEERAAKEIKRREERHMIEGTRIRILRDGSVGQYINGRLVYRVAMADIPGVTPKGQKRKRKRNKRKR